jgi:hypothetical protein
MFGSSRRSVRRAGVDSDYLSTLDEEPPLTAYMEPADQVPPVILPGNVRFHLEDEYAAGEDEQRAAYAERAAVLAREEEARAAGLDHVAAMAVARSTAAAAVAAKARATCTDAYEVLAKYARRPASVKTLYWLRLGLIVLGDVAGIYGAALLLGEEQVNALFQAISSAVVAITLGTCGRELRYLEAARARQRERDELTERELEYAWFFAGRSPGSRILWSLVSACMAGLVFVAISIFTLRDATEGRAPGLVFGLLALALGIASLYNSFDATCDVAEYLAEAEAAASNAERRADALHEADVIIRRNEAACRAARIREAQKAAGEAAAAGVRRTLHRALGHSAGLAGHGYRTDAAVPRADPGPILSVTRPGWPPPRPGRNGHGGTAADPDPGMATP